VATNPDASAEEIQQQVDGLTKDNRILSVDIQAKERALKKISNNKMRQRGILEIQRLKAQGVFRQGEIEALERRAASAVKADTRRAADLKSKQTKAAEALEDNARRESAWTIIEDRLHDNDADTTSIKRAKTTFLNGDATDIQAFDIGMEGKRRADAEARRVAAEEKAAAAAAASTPRAKATAKVEQGRIEDELEGPKGPTEETKRATDNTIQERGGDITKFIDQARTQMPERVDEWKDEDGKTHKDKLAPTMEDSEAAAKKAWNRWARKWGRRQSFETDEEFEAAKAKAFDEIEAAFDLDRDESFAGFGAATKKARELLEDR